jgi:dephospho-CoA kinase
MYLTPMLTLGITGGLATGKSLVTRLMREHGAVVFSADQAARAVLIPNGQTLRQIAEAFGPDVLNADGSLDRALLGRRVFADTSARSILNRITHPPILRLLRAQMDACSVDLPPDTIVAVEVPLLFETKIQTWFERIVVVTASERVQVSRLDVRDLLPEAEAYSRIAAQMPLSHKIALADGVIVNDGSVETLTAAVDTLWNELKRPQIARREIVL